MRTTLTLDPDVVRLLEDEARRQRKTWKQVVNDSIRRGLLPAPRSRPAARYHVRPHKTALGPGIEIASFNRLADELEDEAIVEKMRTGR
jgi:hypothetical protein